MKLSDLNEHTAYGQDYVVFDAVQPTRLVVVFGSSGHPHPGVYNYRRSISQLHLCRTTFLFLKDHDNGFYLDTEPYLNIIADVVCERGLQDVPLYTLGSSMGGYGALRLGLLCGATGVVAANPYVRLAYRAKTLQARLAHLPWVDVDVALAEAERLPLLYLECGVDYADMRSVRALVAAYDTNSQPGLCAVRQTVNTDHSTIECSVRQLVAAIELFETFTL